jgi:hypothetical protein
MRKPGTIASLALVVTTSLVTPRPAVAQGADAAPAATRATRVRVSTNLPNVRPQGRLAFASPDSLVVVDSHGNATRILRANVTALDTSAGRFRHPWQGLGIGLLAGGATGMVIGFADGDDPQQAFLAMTASEKAVLGGAVVGVLGGLTGLVVGSLVKSDRWHRTTLDAIHVTARPARGGGFSLSLSLPTGRRSVAPGRSH